MSLVESAPLVRPASTFAAPPENTYRTVAPVLRSGKRQCQGLRECAALLLFWNQLRGANGFDHCSVCRLARRGAGEPGIQNFSAIAGVVARMLRQSTLASFHSRAPPAVAASPQSAARTPGILFAAMHTPVPVQQHSTPYSTSRSATAFPTRRPTEGHASSPSGDSTPNFRTSCPRSHSHRSIASASSPAMSLPNATRIGKVFAAR